MAFRLIINPFTGELDMTGGTLDADLDAIAALTGTGIASRTGADTWALTPGTEGRVMFWASGGVTPADDDGFIFEPIGNTLTLGKNGENALVNVGQGGVAGSNAQVYMDCGAAGVTALSLRTNGVVEAGFTRSPVADKTFLDFSGPLVFRTPGVTKATLSAIGALRLGDANAPVAGQFESHQATLGSPVARFESTATNDDPRCDWAQGRVETTNATATVLSKILLNLTETVLIEAYVTARRTGGTAGTADDGATYVLRAHVDRGGALGLMRIVNQQQSFVSEHQAAWNATFAVDADFISVDIQVTGAANNNITWHTTYKIMRVGT